eukprot:gene20513-biopygen8570
MDVTREFYRGIDSPPLAQVVVDGIQARSSTESGQGYPPLSLTVGISITVGKLGWHIYLLNASVEQFLTGFRAQTSAITSEPASSTR